MHMVNPLRKASGTQRPAREDELASSFMVLIVSQVVYRRKDVALINVKVPSSILGLRKPFYFFIS
jgi:hypothetical protein